MKTILVREKLMLDYSVCWGEFNYLKSFKTPIVFNNLKIDEEKEQHVLVIGLFDSSMLGVLLGLRTTV